MTSIKVTPTGPSVTVDIGVPGPIGPAGPAGATTFVSLTDTPSTYSGQGGKAVAVKGDASGLEFIPAATPFDPTNPGPIGGTTPNTGNFTRLSVAQGTLTDPVTGLSLSATWNDATKVFDGAVIDIAGLNNSASGSALLHLKGLPRFQGGGRNYIFCGEKGVAEIFKVGINGDVSAFGYTGTEFRSGNGAFKIESSLGMVINSGGGYAGNGLFFGNAINTLQSAATIRSEADIHLTRNAASVLRLSANGTDTGAALEGFEQTAPAAPAANGYRIFAEDDGSGKTRLMVRFATGASQQIAVEP